MKYGPLFEIKKLKNYLKHYVMQKSNSYTEIQYHYN